MKALQASYSAVDRPTAMRWKLSRTWGAIVAITFLCVYTALQLNIAPLDSLIRLDGRTHDNFAHLANHCAHIQSIAHHSFLERQQSLARTLLSLNASSYVAEPGANAAFFANVSKSQWWLSERPLLLVISPVIDTNGDIRTNVSVLTPAFEATRAKLLQIPSASDTAFTAWPEDTDPYSVAVAGMPQLQDGVIFVDSSMRKFIADGLQRAAPYSKVASAPVEIMRLRERKSPEELEIMKCANEATVLAIRAARQEMHFGMRESVARNLIEEAMLAAGLQGAEALTLFGENAALPHGSGTDRTLGKHDFVLIDAVGSLHGYSSDVTRTFALPGSTIPSSHLRLWDLVHAAQANALQAAKNGTITADVDAAARRTISDEGYGQYFTHRLGHGIGLETHEFPYLRGGSSDLILTGHTFSDEPGIYIEGQVGIRLEDCFYIGENGDAIFLTAGIGGPARNPWNL
ncbi:peptidase M24 [Obba rivulosa]|uniref:Peptidase M24 n=1 Tax=Obba rivulosa TaxID=1052685 RepID=A0A8E2DSN0_9APHY|nr:peptidase M24 [Obba rivulosa]